MSNSKIFLYSLILFIAGVAVGNFFVLPAFFIFCVLLAGIFFTLIILANKNKFNQTNRNFCFYVLMFSCSFVFGLWRYQISLPDYSDSNKIYHYASSTAEFIGEIKNIDTRLSGQSLTIEAKQMKLVAKTEDNKIRNTSGQVLVNLPLYPEYDLNDKIKIKCPLLKPGLIEDFDYGKYLAKSDIYVTCGWPEVIAVQKKSFPTINSIIFQLRKYLSRRLNSVISEPEVSLLRGILLGDSRGLADEYKQKFADLGLSHIVAISGDHIAIVAAALVQIFLILGLSRIKSFWPLAIMIAFYVALVGSPASAVRAAIMALTVLYAQKIGRTGQIINVMILTAAVMILISPKILLSDVGFQLSFMAVWGLYYISPLITARLEKWPDLFRTKEIFIATLSAQLATWPIMIYYFGNFSPISFVANILVLPVIGYLTIWGLANLVAVAIFLPLGQLMGYVSWLMTAYWIGVAEILHQIPFGYFKLAKVDIWMVFGLYLLLAGLLFWLKKSREK